MDDENLLARERLDSVSSMSSSHMSSELDSEYNEEDQERDRNRRKNKEEARLKQKTMRGVPILVSILIFVLQIALFIGFAYFSYGPTSMRKIECYANPLVFHPVTVDSVINSTQAIDVTWRFQCVIRFAFYIMTLEILRQVIAQVAYYRRSYKLLYLALVIQAINLTFMIIDFVLMQMWRMDEPGKVCSGDYVPEGEVISDVYLAQEGLFLKCIIITAYSILGLSCLSVIVIAVFLSARKTQAEVQKGKTGFQVAIGAQADVQ